ncbi:hypothetical protein V6N13_065604 [Hibiscus sabdariffa]|uniref:Uncharacterized protein n=1 Tax=Hibiscus sabdariffa TaxID=183260 RepID=A0ABR2QQD0_9ROSI
MGKGEPEERYGPWMQVTGRKSRRTISFKGNVRGTLGESPSNGVPSRRFFVQQSGESFSRKDEAVASTSAGGAPTSSVEGQGRVALKQYVILTKERVMSLAAYVGSTLQGS